ncbi:beta/gamma crystallin domain-containing protein [Streptomyces sp. NPDC058221]|uniref:beta/gamma crystallin domain-containing protein n=1 Tax=Streptomyces sp. NPDC058221 TaxID=3346388 RepID=UPI0036E7F40F
MFSTKKSVARTTAAALAVAAAFALGGPVATASAIDHVTCDPAAGFLKIWSHASNGGQHVDCYANAGKTDFGGRWIDQISTGNNDVKYYDVNGDVVSIPRGSNLKYNNVPHVKAIEIL